jgi:hypothetical protein
MRKIVFVLLSFSLLAFFPGVVLSDCTDLGRFTSWTVQGENTIIFYSQNSPIAQVVLQDCTVNLSSNIRLTKSYICDGDSLIVDGQECSIMTLTSASSGSL